MPQPHHQRRKSGHNYNNNSSSSNNNNNTSVTDSTNTVSTKTVTVSDMSKPRRPNMSRRQTPVNAQKLGKGPRERERDRLDAWDDERESFPQFCMTCEKQFVPYHQHGSIYCSETCRRVDQSYSSAAVSASMPRSCNGTDGRGHGHGHAFYSADDSQPKDIIPQASPSRPPSVMFGASPPRTPGTAVHGYGYGYGGSSSASSSAMAALRSLSLNGRPPSPPSPSGSSTASSSVWPFGAGPGAGAAAGSDLYSYQHQSPATSYSRPSAFYLSSTYDAAYDGGYYDLGSATADRPLPSRHPGYHSRPKSIELVTPTISR
ncbi:hypothetical protein GMORB2_2284 [Geosmithia morbida]|uniref:Uncharacterized protein n=1 Tax=Geosmithia morbida TaxID=1094350 RepID=A0A9P5D076_9HYPO|nr:uncharacterized protein GMORB2_2284 [Geosmithia morbida]KAF4121322.1 hypothetical protein GMORB2_2284 [Geosmithia morbida]